METKYGFANMEPINQSSVFRFLKSFLLRPFGPTDYSKSRKESHSLEQTGPNGHLEFRGKTNMVQYCDMTQCKNSVRSRSLLGD